MAKTRTPTFLGVLCRVGRSVQNMATFLNSGDMVRAFPQGAGLILKRIELSRHAHAHDEICSSL